MKKKPGTKIYVSIPGSTWVKQWKKLYNKIVFIDSPKEKKNYNDFSQAFFDQNHQLIFNRNFLRDSLTINPGLIFGIIHGHSVRVKLKRLEQSTWETIVKIFCQQAWLPLIFYQSDLYFDDDMSWSYRAHLNSTKRTTNIPLYSYSEFIKKLPINLFLDLDKKLEEENISMLPNSLKTFEITCDCTDFVSGSDIYCNHVKKVFELFETKLSINPFSLFTFRGENPMDFAQKITDYERKHYFSNKKTNKTSQNNNTDLEFCDFDKYSSFWEGNTSSSFSKQKNLVQNLTNQYLKSTNFNLELPRFLNFYEMYNEFKDFLSFASKNILSGTDPKDIPTFHPPKPRKRSKSRMKKRRYYNDYDDDDYDDNDYDNDDYDDDDYDYDDDDYDDDDYDDDNSFEDDFHPSKLKF